MLVLKKIVHLPLFIQILNKLLKKQLILAFLIFVGIVTQANDTKIQQLIHLLDYLASDYPSAVKDHNVVNNQEYTEMKEFASKITEQFKQAKLDTNQQLLAQINQIPVLVNQKASSSDIIKVCSESKNKIIEQTGYITYPKNWPNLAEAEVIYSVNCARCHGTDGYGNGPDGVGLNPPPRNLHERERMRTISPLHAFNTIRLGIEGTSMPKFDQLTETQVWDVAFYVTSMYHNKPDSVTIQKNFNQYVDKISLDELAKISDQELAQKIKDTNEVEIASIRLGSPSKQKENFLLLAKNGLSASYQAYINKDYSLAEQEAINAYLQGIEPIELQIKSLNPLLKDKIEKAMMLVRKDISKKVPNSKLQADIFSCYSVIEEIKILLDSEKKSNTWSFFLSFSIIIREALEAVLILIIIINVIKTLHVKKALYWVHAGWISALLVGCISWFFSEKLLEIGMDKIEFFEGVVSLIAVIIVIYLGFWMHQHTEINKWKAFVNDKIKALVDSNNYKGLALLSFIVTGREVFECVLFLSALGAQKGADSNIHLSIISGVIAALVVVIIISYIFINYTKNIPIRLLLKASSIVLGILSVILIGKAAHSFQETGHLPIHSILVNFRVELLGIYPTIESISAQLLIAILVIFLLFIHKPSVNK